MKTLAVSIMIFAIPIAIGVLGIPWLLWAIDGFPSGDSHGGWLPALFALYIGLPGGIILGIAGVIIYLFYLKIRKHRRSLNDESK